MTAQLCWLVGLVTCVCVAVIGQSDLVGEPWKHWLTVTSVVGTAITGYMLQRPFPQWDGTERRSQER